MKLTPATAETFALEAALKAASKTLAAFTSLPSGLHADSVKSSPGYVAAKAKADAAFQALRNHNALRAR